MSRKNTAFMLTGIPKFCRVSHRRNFFYLLATKRISRRMLAKELELCYTTFESRISKGIWFSQGEYERIKEVLQATDEELMECFDISEEGMEVIKRSGNGYSVDFTAGGKEHTAYGKTELECKVNAEKRKKEIEQAETQSDAITLKITKSEAIKLSYTLVRAIDKCTDDSMRNALTSLYFRISSQVI